MSRDQLQSLENINHIEIVSSIENSVSFKNGSLKCRLRPDTFRRVGRHLWPAILSLALTKEMSTILNAAICQSKKRKP